jgi:polysaccharide pyruvyl transferase WcaK-like protein
MKMPLYVICGVRYSDNLGDGVIAACTAYLASRVRPGIEIRYFDLAGRSRFEPRPARHISLTKRVFYALPSQLRAAATLTAWFAYKRRAVKTMWSAIRPSGRYSLMFAGGQLISDVALNFPLKIGLLSKLVSQDLVSVAFFSIGVGSRFSLAGRWMLRRAFSRFRIGYFGARDKGSVRSLQADLNYTGEIRQTVDPAVWVQEAFGVERKKRDRPCIGVGIAHPYEIGLHDDARDEDFASYSHLVSALIVEIGLRGWVPILFNNGSAEDDLFMRGLSERLRLDGYDFEVFSRPQVPEELVNAIAELDGVIAHRLHASIIAYGLGIPSVGFEWDRKVQAFYETCDRPYRCIRQGGRAAAQAVSLIEDAVREQNDGGRLLELKQCALDEMQKIVERMDG